MNDTQPVNEKQTVTFKDKNYGGITYHGDVIQKFGEKPDFDEISLKDLNKKFIDSPELQPDLVNRLDKERVLILSGSLGVNKNALALQIACTLANKLNNKFQEGISVKQWRRSANHHLMDLDRELQKTREQTIFVLTDVTPQDIDADEIKQTHDTAKTINNHYVLISTDISFSSWHLETSAKDIFPDIKRENIYISLSKTLKSKLKKDKKLSNVYDFLCNDSQLIEFIAQQLNTPIQIERLLELLRNKVKNDKLSANLKVNFKENIQQFIQLAKNDNQFIKRFYHTILNSREQLLALGISFFHGCFEDQLFAALERVVQGVWQKRDPSLRGLDYCDLDQLQENYFGFYENDFYEAQTTEFKVVKTKDHKIDIRSIKVLSTEDRQILFEVAWESHRLQIVTALDVLVTLVEESVKEENYYSDGKWELYGNSLRSEQLRRVISKTLSDIGLVSNSSFSAVEGRLFRLAINEDWRVRSVAAHAIARWHDPTNRHDEKIFKILQDFYAPVLQRETEYKKRQERELQKRESSLQASNKQTDSNQKDTTETKKSWRFSINKFLGIKQKNEPKKQEQKPDYYFSNEIEAQDYLGSTVAVILGKMISTYQGSKNISDELYDWLEELSKSRLPLVHYFFGYGTLVEVVPLHIHERRLSKLLDETAQTFRGWLPIDVEPISLNHGIARSLARAYSVNREPVQTMMNNWYKQVKNYSHTIKIDNKNALLITLILTYSMLDFNESLSDNSENKIPLNLVLERLKNFAKNQSDFFVRTAITEAASQIIINYFFDIIENNLGNQLQDLIINLNREEQNKIIDTLSTIYCKQIREHQKQINKNNSKVVAQYRTPIEKVMNRWIKLYQKSSTQQFALQALVAFNSVKT